jgi:hypothetical protein
MFTEHGLAMLSSVLNSERAVQDKQREHDSIINILVEEITELKRPGIPEPPKRRIGFRPPDRDE